MSQANESERNEPGLTTVGHDTLRKLLTALERRSKQGEFTDSLREAWQTFEDGLRAHLDAEEMFVFPRYKKVDPNESSALLAEHATIRESLGQLGMLLDLHALRLEMVEEFSKLLDAHAKREDALLYKWMFAELPENVNESIASRLANVAANIKKAIANLSK